MARTVNYHLVSTGTASAAAAATATVLNKGRCVGVRLGYSIQGGAGTGYIMVTGEHNNTGVASGSTVNPNRLLILGAITGGTSNAIQNSNNVFVPCNVPVTAGDTLSLSYVITGTAPATALEQIDFLVEE